MNSIMLGANESSVFSENAELRAKNELLSQENTRILAQWEQDKAVLEKLRRELEYYLDIIGVHSKVLRASDKLTLVKLHREMEEHGASTDEKNADKGYHDVSIRSLAEKTGQSANTVSHAVNRISDIGLISKRLEKEHISTNAKGKDKYLSHVKVKPEAILPFPSLYSVDDDHANKQGGARVKRCSNPKCNSVNLVVCKETKCRDCGAILDYEEFEVNDPKLIVKEQEQAQIVRIEAIVSPPEVFQDEIFEEEPEEPTFFDPENSNLIDSSALKELPQDETFLPTIEDILPSVSTGGGVMIDLSPAPASKIFQLEKSWIEQFENFGNIPLEMQAAKRWALCRFEQEAGKKKKSKVPYKADVHAKVFQPAKSNDAKSWSSFNDAITLFYQSHDESWKVPFDGIMFASGDGWIFTDQDVDKESGELASAAHERLLPTYTEWSLNGGIHQITHGVIPQKRHLKDFEIYDTAQFIMVTGDRFEDMPHEVEYCQEQLTALYEKVIPTQPRNRKEATPPCVYAPMRGSQAEIEQITLHKATNAANAHRFIPLWNGDYSRYPSQSEGDAALCAMLAYWSDYNPVVIDSLYRQSQMCNRQKWDEIHNAKRQTYGEMTIEELAMKNKGRRDCTESTLDMAV